MDPVPGLRIAAAPPRGPGWCERQEVAGGMEGAEPGLHAVVEGGRLGVYRLGAAFFGSPSVVVTRLVCSVFVSGRASAATKYVGLPYMADASHSEDTVFFVAEGDFRFYREDAEREATLMDQLCALYRLGRSLDLVGPAEGVWQAPIPHGTLPPM